MQKKKSAAKVTKKIVKQGGIKSIKKAAPKTIDYLAPLHEITKCIENDYTTHKKLLDAIPQKIEKSLATTKAKLHKAKDTKIKLEKPIAGNKKSKPASKQEKLLSDAKTLLANLESEFKALNEQLQTCKRMRQEYTTVEKLIQKAKADFAKQATTKIKIKKTSKTKI